MKITAISLPRSLFALSALALVGCSHRLSNSTGGIAPEVPLGPSTERQGVLLYRAEGNDTLPFPSFQIAPARIFQGKESRFADISEDDKRRLAERLRESFVQALAGGYEVVDKPRSDTLVLRLTLVDVTTSVPVVSTALRATPIGLALSAGKSAAGSSAAFTGAARVAGEVSDASGRLVGAFVVSEYPLALDLRSGLTKFYATEIAIDQVAANFRKAVDRSVAAAKAKSGK